MHAYMCLCGCVSVCLFVARAMFSFFSFVYFFYKDVKTFAAFVGSYGSPI